MNHPRSSLKPPIKSEFYHRKFHKHVTLFSPRYVKALFDLYEAYNPIYGNKDTKLMIIE